LTSNQIRYYFQYGDTGKVIGVGDEKYVGVQLDGKNIFMFFELHHLRKTLDMNSSRWKLNDNNYIRLGDLVKTNDTDLGNFKGPGKSGYMIAKRDLPKEYGFVYWSNYELDDMKQLNTAEINKFKSMKNRNGESFMTSDTVYYM
jgi:hypothetical protein